MHKISLSLVLILSWCYITSVALTASPILIKDLLGSVAEGDLLLLDLTKIQQSPFREADLDKTLETLRTQGVIVLGMAGPDRASLEDFHSTINYPAASSGVC